MRLTKEFLGSAKITPTDDVVAASIGTWSIEYTVGKYGIDDGGNILIAWRSVSDWQMPQFDNPEDLGFSTVHSSGNVKLKPEVGKKNRRPFDKAVLIRVYDGYLTEGETITLTLGDTRFGSMGIHSQSFRESRHLFKVLVDPFGTSRFEILPEYPELKIIAGSINEIQVVSPSYIKQHQPFEITIRALDEWGNPCENYQDEINLRIFNSENIEFGQSVTAVIKTKDHGYIRYEMPPIETLGTYYIKGKSVSKNISCISNGFICKDTLNKELYWGDAHGQTKLTVGTGTLDEYFQFARGPAALDFTGWQGNDFEVTAEKWNKVIKKTKEYNQPNKFLTFLGYEWSGLTAGGGDHNIYYLGDEGPIYHSNQWLLDGGKEDDGSDRYPISELWEDIEECNDIMAIPHIGGRYANLDYYNPKTTPVIEIHSHHGTFEWFAKDAMKRRLKVGFIATSDDHTCRPGLSYPLQRYGKAKSFDVKSGFTAVYANKLKKETIWDAIRSRNCYATTFARIIIEMESNGKHIGDELKINKEPNLQVNIVGTAPLDFIELYRWDKLIKRDNLNDQSNTPGDTIKIAWSGVRVKTRLKHADWSGMLEISNGKIIDAKTFAFDRNDQGIEMVTPRLLRWESSTSGDIDGMMVKVDQDIDCSIHFHTKLLDFTLPLDEITKEIKVFDVGDVNLKLEISRVNHTYLNDKDNLSSFTNSITFKDQNPLEGENAYWVKVQQKDGHTAWSSPIFINYEKE
jgi:hypothetical protein